MKPEIAITCSVMSDPQSGAPRALVNMTYVDAIARAGGLPLIVPPWTNSAEAAREIIGAVDGLLLIGGHDVSPERLGLAPSALSVPMGALREDHDFALFHEARRQYKPILGICLGCQEINAAMGGTLHQDLLADRPQGLGRHGMRIERSRERHFVRIAPGSRLFSILETEMFEVNTMHHQAVRDLAPGLAASAVAPDGVIEAVETESGPFLLGVQWHPEVLAGRDRSHQAIFDAFVREARPIPGAL